MQKLVMYYFTSYFTWLVFAPCCHQLGVLLKKGGDDMHILLLTISLLGTFGGFALLIYICHKCKCEFKYESNKRKFSITPKELKENSPKTNYKKTD